MSEAFEDRRLRIPADAALRADLHAVQAEPGPTGAPRLVAERSATDGHADRLRSLRLRSRGRTGRADFAASLVGAANVPVAQTMPAPAMTERAHDDGRSP